MDKEEQLNLHPVMKISSNSNPNSIAGALVPLIKESGVADMQVVGAGALNQAIKGITIARGFVAPLGINLACIPSFVNVYIEGEQKTGMRLTVTQLNY